MMGASADLIIARERGKHARSAIALALVLAIIIASAAYTQLFDSARLARGLPALATLARDMMPPDFSNAKSWLHPLLDTAAMSIAGTAMAVLLSLPLAVLAARNTSPNLVVYGLARGLLNTLRAIPELIIGIVFVAAVGFGALPGVLALGLHSIGMIGKFFAEAIEHCDEKPVEAALSVGATPLQVIVHAILPQVAPQLADVALYRWEYNFRASTVMGMVGAGGIGFELIGSLRLMQYQEVSALLLVILAAVTLVDSLGAGLRRHLR
nr:phosphonate ABC transporter, permease protein PhnE [Methyloferula stellata]